MARRRKHTTIKPRHLPDTWVDKDRLLPHVVFEILVQFIEDEAPAERMDWESDAEHRAAWTEMTELYRWWNDVYLPYEADDTWSKSIEAPELTKKKCTSIKGAYEVSFKYSSPEAEAKARAVMQAKYERDESMEQELTNRCKRVLDVRRFMWT